MTNKEKLKELKTLLGHKKNWTRASLARDKYKDPCEPKSKRAFSYCLYGGCERVGIENPAPLFKFIIEGLAHFNDSPKTTHEDVLWAIDKAIKLCKT